MSKDIDDEFIQAAKQAENEERARQAERQNRGNSKNFTEIMWTGPDGNIKGPQTKIIRFIGKHPDLHYGSTIPNISESDARVINLSQIISDNGKRMDMVLPLYDRNPNHIIWRIIDRVNTVEWVKVPDVKDATLTKSVRVFPNAKKFPDVYNIINYSNLPESNPSRKFGLMGKGWKGREILIANVIDREMVEWHKTNKHTVLLAKKITTKQKPDGGVNIFVEKGIPAYGLNALLNNLRKTYGDWEKYDIGFTRTGSKDSPNTICNASRTPEQVLDSLQDLIINNPSLSDEESSWEAYNLNTLFKPTSYTKLWNRLHLTIERIDACFGTYYADELKKLAEAEIESTTVNSNEVSNSEDEEAESEMEEEGFEPEPNPAMVALELTHNPESTVSRRVSKSTNISKSVSTTTPEQLPGWNNLTAREQQGIVSVEEVNGGTWKLTFNDTVTKRLADCPDCGTRSPEDYTHCPGCGVKFM